MNIYWKLIYLIYLITIKLIILLTKNNFIFIKKFENIVIITEQFYIDQVSMKTRLLNQLNRYIL